MSLFLMALICLFMFPPLPSYLVATSLKLRRAYWLRSVANITAVSIVLLVSP